MQKHPYDSKGDTHTLQCGFVTAFHGSSLSVWTEERQQQAAAAERRSTAEEGETEAPAQPGERVEAIRGTDRSDRESGSERL